MQLLHLVAVYCLLVCLVHEITNADGDVNVTTSQNSSVPTTTVSTTTSATSNDTTTTPSTTTSAATTTPSTTTTGTTSSPPQPSTTSSATTTSQSSSVSTSASPLNTYNVQYCRLTCPGTESCDKKCTEFAALLGNKDGIFEDEFVVVTPELGLDQCYVKVEQSLVFAEAKQTCESAMGNLMLVQSLASGVAVYDYMYTKCNGSEESATAWVDMNPDKHKLQHQCPVTEPMFQQVEQLYNASGGQGGITICKEGVCWQNHTVQQSAFICQAPIAPCPTPVYNFMPDVSSCDVLVNNLDGDRGEMHLLPEGAGGGPVAHEKRPCLYVVFKEATWDDASQICTSDGGRLVWIENEDQETLQQQVDQLGKLVFASLTSDNPDQNGSDTIRSPLVHVGVRKVNISVPSELNEQQSSSLTNYWHCPFAGAHQRFIRSEVAPEIRAKWHKSSPIFGHLSVNNDDQTFHIDFSGPKKLPFLCELYLPDRPITTSTSSSTTRPRDLESTSPETDNPVSGTKAPASTPPAPGDVATESAEIADNTTLVIVIVSAVIGVVFLGCIATYIFLVGNKKKDSNGPRDLTKEPGAGCKPISVTSSGDKEAKSKLTDTGTVEAGMAKDRSTSESQSAASSSKEESTTDETKPGEAPVAPKSGEAQVAQSTAGANQESAKSADAAEASESEDETEPPIPKT